MSTSASPSANPTSTANVPKLRPAILVVSDTASADPSSDRTGPALRDLFSRQQLQGGGSKWAEGVAKIVPDDVLSIQREVVGWCDGGATSTIVGAGRGAMSGADEEGDGESGPVNLIVTTGGTGFARRDLTPEVSQ